MKAKKKCYIELCKPACIEIWNGYAELRERPNWEKCHIKIIIVFTIRAKRGILRQADSWWNSSSLPKVGKNKLFDVLASIPACALTTTSVMDTFKKV